MGCKLPICSDHLKVMAHTKVGRVPCQGLGGKALLKLSGLAVLYKSNTFTLPGWQEAFPIPDKSADTIVLTFINKYLPTSTHVP